MSEVYLIRHGRTAWNKEKRFRGRSDVSLDEQGRDEARLTAEALDGVALGRIYSSPLSRAMETAEIVRGERDIRIVPMAAFEDIDYGEWTGRLDSAIREEFPEAHERWLRAPDCVEFPGGESLAEVRERAVAGLRLVAEMCAGVEVAIVSHRVVLKMLLASLKGLPDSWFWRIQVDTGSITRLRTEGATLRVVEENDIRHLAGLSGHESVDF